ncbi:MAG: histidinol-phosphatase [Eubacteriales bacterium]|nr:histidinol-phosphatase [Eubacteriales bacterium]
MNLSNYHTHSTFCDGADAPEEIVREAIRRGCPELGFSGHSHIPFDDCCMSVEGTEEYKAEIRRLREKYADRIRIWLGVEQDIFGDLPTDDYDYVIGSVHFVFRDGRYLSVDESRESFLDHVAHFYGGDILAFAEDYYALVAQVYERTHCRIVGHFDLITKYNEDDCLFDTGDPRYRAAALRALDALADKPVLFEINTGAISRGYRRTPYPAPWILEELQARGAGLILSSDCHRKEDLLCKLGNYRGLPGVRETLF